MNATDVRGYNALKLACERGCEETVKLLIEAGADVNMSNDGTAALRCAAEVGSFTSMKLLLEAGADVNAATPRKCTVLMTAAAFQHDQCVKILIDSGADVNSIDTNNSTAMIQACSEYSYDPRGHACFMKMLQELLKGGATVNLTDIYGQNALENLLVGYINFEKDANKALPMLLHAAGETVNHNFVRQYDERGRVVESKIVPEFMTPQTGEETPSLKHLSREAIRKHLIHLDPHTHLFARVHHLQLPLYLPEYLVYNMSLDKDYAFDDNSDDDDDNHSVHSYSSYSDHSFYSSTSSEED